MWSGSIGDRLTASEDYAGVGLEIVDAHTSQDRYLKFRTNPSTFEVVTDQFFLGQAGSSFVSGSNGNIETLVVVVEILIYLIQAQQP